MQQILFFLKKIKIFRYENPTNPTKSLRQIHAVLFDLS
jgi:hypothetical protein